jgi:hypothetical protein
MSNRNEKILVVRYSPAGASERYPTDVVMGYRWDENARGDLSVYAWRGGVSTLIGSYGSGFWKAVRFDRALIAVREPDPQITKGGEESCGQDQPQVSS